MTTTISPRDSPLEDTETFQALLELCRRKTGKIPLELLVRHVLHICPQGNWPVREAAMHAVLRRVGVGRRDGLRVAVRPRGGEPLGIYETRRAGDTVRPYRTLLETLDPLWGSCDCPDFRRGSLGLCKHLLAVLEDLAGKRRRFRAALAAEAERVPRPRLTWDPVRPLVGAGDWLARLRLVHEGGKPARSVTVQRARKWFARDVEEGWVPKRTFGDDPRRRLTMVEELLPLARVARAGARPKEPAVRALLLDERARLRRIVADRASAGALKRTLRSLERPLYPYQVEGVEHFLAEGTLLLGDDMGLGKTAQAIAACHALWRTRKVRRGLVIVPASLKPQWEREWALFTDAPVEVVEGPPQSRAATWSARREGFLLANYEQVLRDLELIMAFEPDIVVLDEAQRIKNWATKTAKSVKQLRPRYRLVLTGTPMENRLEELASIMDWVDDHALEPKWRLVPFHSTFADRSREVVGAQHLDTLRSRLAGSFLRRRRPEVLKQLPPRTDTIVPVELTDAQRAQHDDLRLPIISLMQTTKRRPLRQAEFLRLMMLLTTQRIISNGIGQLEFTEVWPGISKVADPNEALLEGLSTPKLLELREILARIAVEQGRKVVVFSQWRRMLKLAHWAVDGMLSCHGLRGVFFTGKEGAKRRTNNLVDFHDDPATRVLFATDAGGVGLNLQRAATCCVNLELPWNPAVLEQRVGRIYRLGQTRPIDVYNLVSQDCIESRIAGLVTDKRQLFDGLFDGTSDEVRFDRSGNFLAGIERIVESGELPSVGTDDDGDVDPTPEREVDGLLSAADESLDDVDQALHEAEPEHRADATPAGVPEVHRLFSQIRVHRTAGGGMRIEAPPEAAGTLAALFEGVATLLRGTDRLER